jgi:pimeloyl-ACP methyl ester carboxylesterase
MIEEARGKIDYHEQGSGPTILFVPGSWGTRSAWRGVIAALPGEFRIVTTSLLGYGDTAERRAGTDVFIEREAESRRWLLAARDRGHYRPSLACRGCALHRSRRSKEVGGRRDVEG